MTTPERRVVVTGMGVLAPNGHGLAAFAGALREGKSGALLLVTIETTFSTDAGEKLLVNRQTLIWR